MSSNGTTPQQIETDIARQREQLAATVTQLQARLDVKARAREQLAGLQDRATTDTGRPRPGLLAAAGVVALLVGAALWRRRH